MKKSLNFFLITTFSATCPISAFSQEAVASEPNVQWAEGSPYSPQAKKQQAVPSQNTEIPQTSSKSASVPSPSKTSTSIEKAQTDETSSKRAFLYLGGGAYVLRLSGAKYEGEDKFYDRNFGGAVFGAGNIYSENHYLGIDTGIFAGSYSLSTYPGSYVNYEYKSDVLIIPIHFTYNYFHYFDDAKKYRLRIGPSFGVTIINNHESENFSSWMTRYASEVKKTSAVFSAGGEVGLGFHFTEKAFIDLSYRLTFLKTNMINKSIVTGTNQIDSGDKYGFIGHQIMLSVGVRF